jgi:hypothetical protein
MVDNVHFYKFDATHGRKIEALHAFITNPEYTSITVDVQNSRFFWMHTASVRWQPRHLYLNGFNAQTTTNYTSEAYNSTTASTPFIHYDNIRKRIFLLTRDSTYHYQVRQVTEKNGTLTMDKILCTIDVSIIDNSDFIVYDEHIGALVFHTTRDAGDVLVFYDIDTNVMSTKPSTAVPRGSVFFINQESGTIHGICGIDGKNSLSHFTISIKTGEVSKPVVIYDPSHESVETKEYIATGYNAVDNELVVSMFVSDSSYHNQFLVVDLSTNKRKSIALTEFIDVKSIFYVPNL